MAFGYTDGYLYSRSYLPDDQSWTSWKYCVFGGTWNNVGMFGWSDAMQYPAIKTKANKSGLEDAVSPFFGYKNNSYTWIFVEYKNEIWLQRFNSSGVMDKRKVIMTSPAD